MYLEDEFNRLMAAPYSQLRDSLYYRDISHEDAVVLQKMLEARLGFPDPQGELPEAGWQRSSWCVGG